MSYFFFFNFKHYPAVAVTVAGHATAAGGDGGEFVRPVIKKKWKKKRVIYERDQLSIPFRRKPNYTIVSNKETPLLLEKKIAAPLPKKVLAAVENLGKVISKPVREIPEVKVIQLEEKFPFFNVSIPIKQVKKLPLKISDTQAFASFYSKLEEERLAKQEQQALEILRQEHILKQLKEEKLKRLRQIEEERRLKALQETEDMSLMLAAIGEEELASVLLGLH